MDHCTSESSPQVSGKNANRTAGVLTHLAAVFGIHIRRIELIAIDCRLQYPECYQCITLLMLDDLSALFEASCMVALACRS